MRADRQHPWVIVGGGLAAAEAASTLRKEAFDGRLVVIADEPHRPYERPPLSKAYLRGEIGIEKLWAGEADLWDTPNTELLLGRRAVSLDVDRRRIRLDDGRWQPFDRLLLATGARAVRPAIPGADLPFVHVVRTIEDADRLRTAARQASSVVVAGGGWVAAETAASLRQMGLEVTLVIPRTEILEQRVGATVGAIYSALHEGHGVRLVRGGRVTAIVDGPTGRGVRTWGGEVVLADLVVLGFGAVPNDELAQAAGLPVSNGILVDPYLRTEAPGVLAAGDVAAAFHPRYSRHLRTEHWDAARRQGRTAALNLLGRQVAYDRVPYFYSDQFELGMEAFGLPSDGDRVVIRRDPEGDRFVAMWLAEGRVVAGLHGNDWDAAKPIGRLVRDGLLLDVRQFLDVRVPLEDQFASDRAA